MKTYLFWTILGNVVMVGANDQADAMEVARDLFPPLKQRADVYLLGRLEVIDARPERRGLLFKRPLGADA